MSLDERIRDDLQAAVGRVPAGSPLGSAKVSQRGRRRRRIRRGMWTSVSGIAIVWFVAVALPYDPGGIDSAGPDGVLTVHLGGLGVPVTGREPALEDPAIWIGLPAPSPEFDTSRFGPDLSFEAGEPSADDLHERVKRAVYLGELEGEPFYVYSQPAPSFWDRLFERLAGNFSGDIVGTSLNCCSGGDTDSEDGLPGFSIMTATDEPRLIVAEWLGLPPNVSVVAYQMDGEFVGWQTPVGAASSIRIDQPPDDIVFIGFNSIGEEVKRFQFSMSPNPGGGPTSPTDTGEDGSDTSAGFVSQGLSVDLDDVPSRLQEVINLTAGDQLFRVPIDDATVFVVVSPQRVHIYAESCSTLTADDIPEGLQATCLERTANGQTEHGVFHYPEDNQ